jgi:arylsulfatase
MASQPNILLLLPDQLRPDFLGCYGADFLRTPAIAALACAGARFETAISPSPICVSARASLLTGQHAHTLGTMDNLSWLRPDRQAMGTHTWPEVLSDSGYQTAVIGKMHFYPWDAHEGFSHRSIAEDKRHIYIQDDYAQALAACGLRKQHGNEHQGYQQQKGASSSELPDALQVDRWLAALACDWLAQSDRDRPFALMVGFPGPHCPYDPPALALDDVDLARLPRPTSATPESQSHRAAFVTSYRWAWADLDYAELNAAQTKVLRHLYAGLVARLDTDIATIIQALAGAGRLDNTVVILASDHGDYLGDFGLLCKTTFHEPSVGVPLILTDFRRRLAGSVDTRRASLLDLFPTMVELAGAPAQPQTQGQSLLDAAEPLRVIVGVTTQGAVASSQNHKLVRYRNGVSALFDHDADPHEQENLIEAAACQQVRAELDAALCAGLLEGLRTGHADKRVPQAQAQAPHPFFARGWTRPYPAHIT